MTVTVDTDSPDETRACRWCGGGLEGKRPQAEFCCDRCRTDWHATHAPTGTVKSVRKLARDKVSVTLHFEPDEARRAGNLAVGELAFIGRPTVTEP